MATFQLQNKYCLEAYSGAKSRFKCPNCDKASQFTRYVNTKTGEYLNELVGICNRIDKCGYHYPPKLFFQDTKSLSKGVKVSSKTEINKLLKNCNKLLQQSVDVVSNAQNHHSYNTNTTQKSKYPIDCIPHTLYSKSLKYYDKNNFALGLEQLFGTSLTIEALQRFAIGTAKYPANSSIFWQIDTDWRIRTGKVILYNKNTLKRNKNNVLLQNQQRVVAPVVDWIHSRLMKGQAKKYYSLKQCLFGLHQLNTSSSALLIGIVESEKTAVICNIYLPNMIWMATGGAQNLNSALLQSLDKRKVVLFPDVNQFEVWKEKG